MPNETAHSGDSRRAEPAPFVPFRAIDGGGLLIHPDLFAQTNSRLFCWRYELLGCAKNPHLQSIAQQVFSKNSPTFSSLRQGAGIPGCQPCSEFEPPSINTSAFVSCNRAHIGFWPRTTERHVQLS